MKKLFVLMLGIGLGLALIGCDLFGSTTTTTTTTTTLPDDNVYDIADAAGISAMDPWKNYRLTANIDLNGAEWEPLGTDLAPYSGTFDGQGFTISDFTITEDNAGFAGFFGYVTGDIQNLTLTDVVLDVTPDRAYYAGLLAGYLSGNLTNVAVEGSLVVTNSGGSTYAGLLVGFATSPISATLVAADFIESVLSGCTAEGTLSVSTQLFAYVGGLVGKTFNVELSDCEVIADLTVAAETARIYAGGLVGHNYGGLLIGHEEEITRPNYIATIRCYSVTKINVVSRGTKASVGGLYGYDNYGHIEDCFAYSEIEAAGAELSLGGFTGENWTKTIVSSVSKVLLEVIPSADQIIECGGIAGFLEEETTVEDAFYLLVSETIPTVAGGHPVTAENLGLPTWYGTVLMWEDSAWVTVAQSYLTGYAFPAE